MIKLIIFDWDGTLIDSAEKISSSMSLAIAELGLESRSDGEIRNIIGLGLAESVAHLYPDLAAPELQLLQERYAAHFVAADQIPSAFFPGVADLLGSLAADGRSLAIATGKSRRGLRRALGACDFAEYFQMSRCADETRSKPHPQMLLELLAEADLAASEALMVGDTEYDLAMAANAGMASIGVSFGVHVRERLLRHKPLCVVDSHPELLRYLQGAQVSSE